MSDFEKFLPQDHERATLIGRIWRPGPTPGPGIVLIESGELFDITASYPLISEILNSPDPAALVSSISRRESVGSALDAIENTLARRRDAARPHFLAPADVQSLKACGVTFIDSLLERVIEERCKGDPTRVTQVRALIEAEIGGELRTVRPNSAQAQAAKRALQRRDLWSQYLEVGIGPQVEVFTKSQPLSAIGLGASIGLHRESIWNNPEPEVVLAINAAGKIVGCTLGNDVNLRDFEGRSALLLGVAKDNNASCAIGPFIRLLDGDFGLKDLKQLTVTLNISGIDGFVLQANSNLATISRDIEELTAQVIGPHHQYPDGLMLFTGTMFVPIQDRDAPGEGFTHKLEDVVEISSPKLGILLNRVGFADEVEPWSFGITALMRNLAARGYL
jgi:fumarylacetoacetate (FAA) hydrolase family protein